jgi:hypothetical protein
VEHSPFLKKIATYQSVSQCVCEIVKLSGFERPQKTTKMFELFEVKFEFPKNQKISTVKIMILSRYRYRPVTVPLPSRYRPVTVTPYP